MSEEAFILGRDIGPVTLAVEIKLQRWGIGVTHEYQYKILPGGKTGAPTVLVQGHPNYDMGTSYLGPICINYQYHMVTSLSSDNASVGAPAMFSTIPCTNRPFIRCPVRLHRGPRLQRRPASLLWTYTDLTNLPRVPFGTPQRRLCAYRGARVPVRAPGSGSFNKEPARTEAEVRAARVDALAVEAGCVLALGERGGCSLAFSRWTCMQS
ncbi:hypothetical protein C8J57DRAFT_1237015 [Mycena rebaudengoi]|nr:hypothetical protein C8J57DRAFT_1237015 [Mycena rebaudengoi]